MNIFVAIQSYFGFFLAVELMNCNAILRKNAKSLRRGAGEGHAIFREHPFSKLNVTPSFVEAVKSYKQCLLDCAENPKCWSANFGKKEVLKGVFRCEILPKDRYNESSSFVSQVQDFFHYSIKTPCLDFPCQLGGTCVANYSEDTYECKCKPGLKGQHCEQDIDECTTLPNPCSANATCVNVVASYNCTCNEGFIGDGQTCTVKPPVVLAHSAVLNHISSYPAWDQVANYLSSVQTGTSWQRCWRAAEDGWDVEQTFHPLCDGKGPTITLIRKDDYVYGGYADKSWESPSSRTPVASTKAFLFSLTNINGYAPIKLNVQDSANALHHDKTYGPIFGTGFDMCVSNNAATTTSSYTRARAYPNPPNYCASTSHYCDFYAGISSRHTLSDVEVFFEVFSN